MGKSKGKKRIGEVTKRKDFTKSTSFSKLVLIPCTIVIIMSCLYLIWYLSQRNSTIENIYYIQSFMTSSGQLNDYANKLGMHDPEKDIKWFKTTDEIRIEFGRITLTWEPDMFYQQENLDLLKTIGFTIQIKEDKNKKKVLHLFYKGVELERWVK